MFRRAYRNPMIAVMALVLPLGIAACNSDSSAAASPDNLDIVETAAEAGTFQTLLAAVEATGLTSTLQGSGPFTVFAPTDEAFDALPEGTLEALLDDPEALAEILLYHVVDGRVFAGDLSDGMEVTTLQGETVTISLSGGAQVNDSNITATDVFTANGVIHVIDAVLLPPES